MKSCFLEMLRVFVNKVVSKVWTVNLKEKVVSLDRQVSVLLYIYGDRNT